MDEKNTSSNPASGSTITPAQQSDTSANQSRQQHAPANHTVVEHHNNGNWLCCVPCYWLKRNNSVHKASLTVATLLVTSLLVASPVLFLISAVPASDVPPRDCHFLGTEDGCIYIEGGSAAAISAILGPECSEPQCLGAAARVLASLDRRADPCSDFERYSCGRWRPESGGHSLTDMQGAVNVHLQTLLANISSGNFKKLGIIYKGCLRVRDKPVNLTPMYNLLEHLGGYLPPGTLGPTDLTPLITKILLLDGSPLVNVRLYHHPTASQRQSILIEPPKQTHMNVQEIIERFLPQGMAKNMRNKEIENIMMFIGMLDKLDRKIEVPTGYNISRLQFLFPIVKWCTLFENTLNFNCSSEEDLAYISSKPYLTSLVSTLTQFQKRIIHNTILILYARDRLHELLNNTTPQPSFCAKLTSRLFGRAVGELYVRQFPKGYVEKLEKRADAMFDKVKSTLASRMKTAMWLDGESQNNALNKLESVNGVFLTRPSLNGNDSDPLDEVEIISDNFFETVIKRYEQLRRIRLTDNSIVFPHLVQAHYDPRNNIIYIPLALLVQPHFRSDLPPCLSYSTVGHLFAHTLLHSFTSLESLSAPARLGLAARLDCLSRQQGSMSRRAFQDDWMENMADIGALQTVHQTWRREHTGRRLMGLALAPGQLFHVAAAQIFCSIPESDFHMQPHRINGIMMNTPSFSEAFDCPLGSPMNPIKKCSTW